ncbi:TOR complex subunit lst8 [Blastocladiella emersonii ATCC 22665]|nr:TOR complex subunit lst8 [Blastocladiella emersonii ATCC 22665]
MSATESVILVTAGYDHTIRFWEALSGACSRTIQYPDTQVNKLAVSPDKRYVVAVGNPHVRFYDIQSGNGSPVMSFEGHTGNVTGIQFAADGRWFVTSGEDRTVKVWDMRAPTPSRDYDHRSPVNDVQIHPNQAELVTCDQAGSVRIWDLATNQYTHQLLPEEDVSMRSVAISADGGTLIAGNNKGNCYIWKWVKSELLPIKQLLAHKKYLLKCMISPDTTKFVTCSADGTVKVWDTTDDSYQLVRVLAGHQRWVWDCAFSADSAYLVTASSDHSARLWDLSTGEPIRQYVGHHKAAICVALHDQPTMV